MQPLNGTGFPDANAGASSASRLTNCGECAMVCPTDTIQVWMADASHPEGGEFVIPEGKKKRGDVEEAESASEAG